MHLLSDTYKWTLEEKMELKGISYPITSPFDAKSNERNSAKKKLNGKGKQKGLTGLIDNIEETYIII